MGNRKGRKVRNRTFNREGEVKPCGPGARADLPTAHRAGESPMFGVDLMERICARDNLRSALKRVHSNQGSPGVDGMRVDELADHLRVHWPAIKEELLSGEYSAQPVRRVEIAKPGKQKEKRKLGIPTVLDRFIQQATLQILQSQWDATFSESSYGFRPGRSAHQAIAKAQGYLQSGYGMVVDLDLEAFFDRVNHDRLMSRLAERIADRRVLKLIRGYLQAGILENGLVSVPREGTPQGGPLSPFLSNVVLDEWDKELEQRGHRFVRYGDDCNIYVKSRRAGERVKASLTRFITERLKLRVNEAKSAVDEPHKRQFLGFTFTAGPVTEPTKAFSGLVAAVPVTDPPAEGGDAGASAWRSESVGYGATCWVGEGTTITVRPCQSYVISTAGFAIVCVVCSGSNGKCTGRRKAELIRLGVDPSLAHTTAWSAKGPWRLSHTPGVRRALTNRYFDALGLPRLDPHQRIQPY